MGKIIPYFAALILLFALFPQTVNAEQHPCRITNPVVSDNRLLADLTVPDFLDRETLKGLKKGMTTAIAYRIQVWEDHAKWMDQMVSEKEIRIKINYDPWNRCYILFSRQGDSLLTDEEGVKRHCSEMKKVPVVEINHLEEKRYRIVVKIIVQPMSPENYQEIIRWLADETEEINTRQLSKSRSPFKKAGNWLLNIVVNVTGFGDRVILTESAPFMWHQGELKIIPPEETGKQE